MSLWVKTISFNLENTLIIFMLTSMALLLLKTHDNMVTPCSVKQ